MYCCKRSFNTLTLLRLVEIPSQMLIEIQQHLQKMDEQKSLARLASASNSPTSRYHGEDDEDVSGDDSLMLLQ